MSVNGRDDTLWFVLVVAIALIWTLAFWLGFAFAILVGAA